MNIAKKTKLICDWLKQGYEVYNYNSKQFAFRKSFGTLVVYNNKVYRTNYSPNEVKGFIKDIFGLDTEFYIINEYGDYICTNSDLNIINTEKTIETTYAESTDMTFILKNTYKNNECICTEVVGFYHGKPEENLTNQYIGKLKACYNEEV